MLFGSCVTVEEAVTGGCVAREDAVTVLFLLQLPDFQATYLRFIIKSGFDHFVSVHRVMAEGMARDT